MVVYIGGKTNRKAGVEALEDQPHQKPQTKVPTGIIRHGEHEAKGLQRVGRGHSFPQGAVEGAGKGRGGEAQHQDAPSSTLSDLFSFPSSCLGTNLGAKLCFA